VEILDVYQQCLPIACQQIGLQSLPTNLQLSRIIPGQGLETVGQFDFAYSWSVFEHVSQDMLRTALSSIKAVLRPGGLFFLQISPLYYSSNGSHMGPWVPEPWAHVILQQDLFHRALLAAAPTSPTVRGEWSVYIPLKADTATERASLWDTYVTLNKVTAPELCRMSRDAGFEIIRDYRTNSEAAIPPHLTEIYDEEALKTEQIVLLMRNPD
jgi:SAM-dependent methyltransferase